MASVGDRTVVIAVVVLHGQESWPWRLQSFNGYLIVRDTSHLAQVYHCDPCQRLGQRLVKTRSCSLRGWWTNALCCQLHSWQRPR
jgi:hypothetical protein